MSILVVFYAVAAAFFLLFLGPMVKYIYEQPMSMTPVIVRGRIRDKVLVVNSVRDGKIRLGDRVMGVWCSDCTVVAFESGHGDFGTYVVDLWQNTPKECTFIATRPFKLIEE